MEQMTPKEPTSPPLRPQPLNAKEQACLALVDLLQHVRTEFNDGLGVITEEEGANILPVDLLISLLRMNDRLNRLIGRGRAYIPDDIGARSQRQGKSWDQLARNQIDAL